MVIYMIKSPKGKVYIGRTTDFGRRMIEHKHASKKSYNTKHDYALYRAIRKYGWDNFEKRILVETNDPNLLKTLEIEFIDAHDAYKRGYNNARGSDGGDVYKDNPERLERMKKINSDMFSGDKNPMFGKTHSDEAKALQKQKAKGRFSLEWYKERNGDSEGTRLYEERCYKLKHRNLQKDSKGRFIKKH